jgi:hypothetical protein
MWEVVALEAETLPPELDGIAGDYGQRSESFSLSRRDDPGRDRIILLEGRVAAFTRDGVRYELSPTTEPNAYAVLVNGKTYTVRIYHYCQGTRPPMPQDAQNLACPTMLSEKVPCSFSCAPGFELSDPSMLVGTLACTASGNFTANSSCVRPGAPQIAASSAAAPIDAATSTTSAPAEPFPIEVKVKVAAPEPKWWIAVVAVLGVGLVAAAIFVLVKRRRVRR